MYELKNNIIESAVGIGKGVPAENLARAGVGMWEEALNFLDSFVYFSHQGEK